MDMKRLTPLLIGLLAWSVMGCNSTPTPVDPSSSAAPVVPNPWVNNNGTGSSNLPNSGSTVALATSADQMQQFTGHPIGDASTVTLTIQLNNYQGQNFTGNYMGYATITYNNQGNYKQDVLWTGDGGNDTQYNIWYTDPGTGKQIFHAFFEDEPPPYPYTQTAGGVILVIDQASSLGDGTIPDQLGGTIWFKNYAVATAPKPDTKCWFISIGPYDCQTWKAPGYTVDPRLRVNPDTIDGYALLGTFNGLSAQDAFAIQ